MSEPAAQPAIDERPFPRDAATLRWFGTAAIAGLGIIGGGYLLLNCVLAIIPDDSPIRVNGVQLVDTARASVALVGDDSPIAHKFCGPVLAERLEFTGSRSWRGRVGA